MPHVWKQLKNLLFGFDADSVPGMERADDLLAPAAGQGRPVGRSGVVAAGLSPRRLGFRRCLASWNLFADEAVDGGSGTSDHRRRILSSAFPFASSSMSLSR